MKKPTISIPHCIWRDGRPRFVPGPGLRNLGFKGQDLKHGADTWFSVDETMAFSEDIQRQAQERRQKTTTSPPQTTARRPRGPITLGQVVGAWFESPRLQGRSISVGKRTARPLAPATVKLYKQMARIFQDDYPKIWSSPATAISEVAVYRMYERIYEKRGLVMARAMIITMGAAWKHGGKTGKVPKTNPFHRVDMETPPGRLRIGTIAEMEHLIAVADAIGHPDIGDSIMMGLATAQRKVDRLQLEARGIIEGELHFRQTKRGAMVIAPAIPQLVVRLNAARDRRKDWRVNYPHVILDEKRRQPFEAKHNFDRYKRMFNKVRAAAVAGVYEQTGTEILPPMPSLSDFRDQDLRDTSVTWLANASCSIPEICSITGHSEKSVHEILKHYLGQDPERARTAIGKLVKWLERKGANL